MELATVVICVLEVERIHLFSHYQEPAGEPVSWVIPASCSCPAFTVLTVIFCCIVLLFPVVFGFFVVFCCCGFSGLLFKVQGNGSGQLRCCLTSHICFIGFAIFQLFGSLVRWLFG